MSKLAHTLLTSFITIVVLAGAATLVILYLPGKNDESGAAAIDDMVEYSYETDDITTDLEDGSFVRIQFQVLTDGEGAKEEISKRDFQINNILIKELATMDEKKFKSGLDDLESDVKDKLNELMTEGKVTDVYTISKILQ